jgi:hypothetical protein
MSEAYDLLHRGFDRLTHGIGDLVLARERRFIYTIVILYAGLILGLYGLKKYGIVSEHEVISRTFFASCVGFILSQVAFIKRSKSLEAALRVKSTIVSLYEEGPMPESCVSGYIAVGDRAAQILHHSKDAPAGPKRALLAFSLVAIETCQKELDQMLLKQRIERSGYLAYHLTKRCYEFASSHIQAVALADEQSLHFWRDFEGAGRFFYKCNQEASKHASITRYFVFTKRELDALTSDAAYLALATEALQAYVENLPSVVLHSV